MLCFFYIQYNGLLKENTFSLRLRSIVSLLFEICINVTTVTVIHFYDEEAQIANKSKPQCKGAGVH